MVTVMTLSSRCLTLTPAYTMIFLSQQETWRTQMRAPVDGDRHGWSRYFFGGIGEQRTESLPNLFSDIWCYDTAKALWYNSQIGSVAACSLTLRAGCR